MTSPNKTLTFIISQFPNYRTFIIDLYKDSDSFRALCEDYRECKLVLDRIKSSKDMVKKGYEEEYKELLQELEDELIKVIDF